MHSVSDLFDPKYKGKVEMLTEMRDTVPLVMKCRRRRPRQGDRSRLAGRDRQDQGAAADSGQIRRFTGNDYASDLANGNAVAVIGWSGDAVQLQADNPNIEWRMPTEGCILWSDNMVIPVGRAEPDRRRGFMNYVYDPKNQAQIEAYVNYVTPVEGRESPSSKKRPGDRQQQTDLPAGVVHQELLHPAVTDAANWRAERDPAFNAVLNG